MFHMPTLQARRGVHGGRTVDPPYCLRQYRRGSENLLLRTSDAGKTAPDKAARLHRRDGVWRRQPLWALGGIWGGTLAAMPAMVFIMPAMAEGATIGTSPAAIIGTRTPRSRSVFWPKLVLRAVATAAECRAALSFQAAGGGCFAWGLDAIRKRRPDDPAAPEHRHRA